MPPLRTATRRHPLRLSVGALLFALLGVTFALPAQAATPAGQVWTSQTAAAGSDWLPVAYVGGKFITAATRSASNQVMTSPDGISWTAYTVANASDIYSRGIAYGAGMFVIVGVRQFSSYDIMTSPDGVTWTARSISNHEWTSVTYGNGLFVAVSKDGYRMTSADGINWTAAALPADKDWSSVIYAGGQFVAVGEAGTGGAMTSPDGTTWTLRTAANGAWTSVTYGAGTYVATAWSGAVQSMSSTDGITWTGHAVPEASEWLSVTYGDGLFVSVSWNASGNRVMTSTDGAVWTRVPAAAQRQWVGVTYGNGTFVSVARYAGVNSVMTSAAIVDPVLPMEQWTVVRQALPMPASGQCADVVDSDFAWGTGLNGGWVKGWEPWVTYSDPTIPRGGWACVRSLVNTGGNRWILGGA